MAEVLLRCGVPETKIATELGIPIADVRLLTKSASARSVTFKTNLNPADQALAEGLRSLAWQALRHAEETMMFGSPADQNLLSRSIVSRSMALIGAEKSSEMDDLRESFNELVGATGTPADFDEADLPEDRDYIDLEPDAT